MKAKVEIFFGPGAGTWEMEENARYLPCLYICTLCQEIWARISTASYRHPYILEISCPFCPVNTKFYHYLQQSVPGSLIWNWTDSEGNEHIDEKIVSSLPLALLKRELQLHIKSFEESYVSSTNISS